eukprot:7439686-Pyramimonas_sp.AAC.1
MLDVQQGSRPAVYHSEAAAKARGRTEKWSAAIQSLREASRQCAKISPGVYIATATACGKAQ